MSSECFSKLEIDAIGEVLNISLGASATAVSTIAEYSRRHYNPGCKRHEKRRVSKWVEWNRQSVLRSHISRDWKEITLCF